MKLSKKGFVASAVLYSLLLLFLALILGLLALLSNRKNILDKLKSDIKGNITKINVFDFYENGTTVYYNPVKGELCANYTEDNSKTGVTEGCLKWYTFNDNANNASVNMILDHNTTALVAWNSSGNINDGMNEVKTALESDTIGWKQTARLISADEVAQITGADKALKWSSIKEIGTSDCDINIQSSSYYLDGLGNPNNTYSKTDGWQHKLSTVVGSNKFYWLFDYMNDCTSSGCMINDSSTYGYWTSTPRFGTLPYAWMVERSGWISTNSIDISQYYGVRPVITIKKSELKLKENTKFVYNYTGKEQNFITPVDGKYKIELWGAQGGNTFDSTTSGGLGGYVSGSINLKKNDNIYIYVGQQGTAIQNNKIFNGGTSDNGGWNGGGATDARLVNGSWDNFNSLKSRIIVAAGGGTEFQAGLAGDAGGLTGYQGSGTLGGTQTSSANSQATIYASSNFGIANGGCTGGNGYYSGGGATCASGSGGGSSFISGHEGCNAIASTSTEDNITHTGQSKHYSGLYFTDTLMIDGKGYSWTNVIGTNVVKMPTHDGKSTMIGNSGNGYAKITYLGS